MRVFAWIMIVLVVLSALFVGYSLYAAELRVQGVRVTAVPAAQMQQQFDALKQALAYDAVKGLVYQNAPLGEAEQYEFHVYSIDVRNIGFFQAEWIEAAIPETATTILQENVLYPPSIPAFGQGYVQALVLAQAGSAPAQSATLTYFVLGRPYSLPLLVNEMARQ